jgi:ferrochelatase
MKALADALRESLAPAGIQVGMAMTYGEPSVRKILPGLLDSGVRRLLVLPLYPQYSATSTAAAFDAVFAALTNARRMPALRTIADYHADAGYIDALAASVEKYWFTRGRGERLLLSFHGIPERCVVAGDPYREQCLKTADCLRERLGIAASELHVTFQSRVGRETWLQPYTDTTLTDLARDGVRHAQVLCPGFAVDCLETLEEIAIRGREQFLAAGGERLDCIPALNASKAHVHMLCELIQRHVRDWHDGHA